MTIQGIFVYKILMLHFSLRYISATRNIKVERTEGNKTQ